MAKRTKKSNKKGKWTDSLDPEAVHEALEEATVDAHDESAQHTDLLTVIQDEVEFPFPALVLGEKVNIVDMEWPDDEVGLDFVCERKGKRQEERGNQRRARPLIRRARIHIVPRIINDRSAP